MLVALIAGCERGPAPARSTPAASSGRDALPAASAPTVDDAGCAAGWWPLAHGDRWRWRLTRRWTDERGAAREQVVDREVRVRRVSSQSPRFVIEGWPRPWNDEPTEAITIERAGHALVRGAVTDVALAPWFELTGTAKDGPLRTVTAGDAAHPAVLELVWPSMADDLTLRLACGQGPISLAYHHHGTLESLTAIRQPR
jgi:hypothetical protein